MIEQLTDDQIALFPDYKQRFLDVGLSTVPVNFERAKKALSTFFEFDIAGVNWSFVESPTSVPASAQILSYGSNEASWYGFYMYFNEQFGICESINEISDVINDTFWSYWDEKSNTVFVVDRPEYIKMNDDGLLNCENGPSIKFKDGFSVYSWRGTRVPAEWIENKESITIDDFLHHKNIEMRRVASEIVGWNNVLKHLNAKVIDTDDDPEVGTLIEVDIPGVGKERFLRALCGTKREFAISVPIHIETALAAQADCYGFENVSDFIKPEIRT